jgi:hypothetical protein
VSRIRQIRLGGGWFLAVVDSALGPGRRPIFYRRLILKRDPTVKCTKADGATGLFSFVVGVAHGRGQSFHRLDLDLSGSRLAAVRSVRIVAKFAAKHRIDSILLARRCRIAGEARLNRQKSRLFPSLALFPRLAA